LGSNPVSHRELAILKKEWAQELHEEIDNLDPQEGMQETKKAITRIIKEYQGKSLVARTNLSKQGKNETNPYITCENASVERTAELIERGGQRYYTTSHDESRFEDNLKAMLESLNYPTPRVNFS